MPPYDSSKNCNDTATTTSTSLFSLPAAMTKSDATGKEYIQDNKAQMLCAFDTEANDMTEDLATLDEDDTKATEKSFSESGTTVVGERPPTKSNDDDGGYGWVVVFGASLSAFTAFSTMQSVMQDYLVLHMFHNTKRAQTLASFVGTICYFVSEIVTPLVQMVLERLGVRITLVIGTLMVSGGLIASGFATTVWHLYLSQGVCYGAGISTIYLAIMTVIPQWFVRRRSTATGIATSGIGLAGLIIPYVMYTSNTALGASWTFRILGFIYLGANLLACILVKEKINKKESCDGATSSYKEYVVPSDNNEDAEKLNNKLSRATVAELLTDINFLTYTASAFLQVLSRNVPFFFLPSYATFIGLSATQGASLISIACAASFVGRILVGMLADRFGNLHVAALFGIITGLSSMLLWMFAYSYPALIALAVIIGFSFDTYYILMPPTLLEILSPQKFTTGLSMLMVLTSPAILGPSMISAVDDALNCEQFLPHKIFSGVLPILSSITMLVLARRIKKMQ